MKKLFLVLAALALAFGLVLLSCDKQPSRLNGPEGDSPQVGKGVPQTALDRVMAIQNGHSQALMHIPGVVGTATTIDEAGIPTIVVLTEEAAVQGIPGNLDGVPVETVVSGKITARIKPEKTSHSPSVNPAARFPRPVPIGVSTGHFSITAGTISARVKDTGGRLYALSNNHVYADEGAAKTGDNVLQPGPYDGGLNPADAIGTLAAFSPIRFNGSPNTIDAAIALSSAAILGTATPANGYGKPKSVTRAAQIRQPVMKYGRTTGLTRGKVYAINATVNVGYDSGTALFTGQIIITPGSFSAGGDSGSLIVSAENGDNYRKPVGLLFAGSQSITIANPIGPVLDYFGITIDGE